jgi:hypothetical protein
MQNVYVLSENTLQHHSMPLLDSHIAAFVLTYYGYVQFQHKLSWLNKHKLIILLCFFSNLPLIPQKHSLFV